MRGRLSTVDLYNVKPLVPGVYRPKVQPTTPWPAVNIIEGTTPKLQPVQRQYLKLTERWMPRRWPTTLGDDIEPLVLAPRQDFSLTPASVPAYVPVAASAPSTPGFWQSIASGLSSSVASVLPAFAQIKTAQLMTGQQAQLLQQQGNQLYTTSNIRTLQQQAEFEAAQRLVDQGRATGATSLPISSTMLIGVVVVGGLIYAMTRK